LVKIEHLVENKIELYGSKLLIEIARKLCFRHFTDDDRKAAQEIWNRKMQNMRAIPVTTYEVENHKFVPKVIYKKSESFVLDPDSSLSDAAKQLYYQKLFE